MPFLYDKIIAALEARSLDTIVVQLKNNAKNALSIRVSDNPLQKVDPGRSCFGGMPSVPDHFQWPKINDRLLTFVGQLSLAEINQYDHDNLLPSEGILYLFYDAVIQPWGDEFGDNAAFKVIYYQGSADLCVSAEELGYDYNHEPVYPLTFHAGVEYPLLSPMIESLMSENTYKQYMDIVVQTEFDAVCHKILGYADTVQDEMQEQLVLVAEEALGILSKESDWILLMQIDSDPLLDWEWGVGGVCISGSENRISPLPISITCGCFCKVINLSHFSMGFNTCPDSYRQVRETGRQNVCQLLRGCFGIQ